MLKYCGILKTVLSINLTIFVCFYRLRGTISIYDFTVDQLTEGVPEECLSTFDQPEAYNYNIRLAVPYDNI